MYFEINRDKIWETDKCFQLDKFTLVSLKLGGCDSEFSVVAGCKNYRFKKLTKLTVEQEISFLEYIK